MEERQSASLRAPRYVGEDTSETREREIRGWYCYGLAAEVFAVCAVGTFLPVTLEQLARERGVLFSDPTTSCVAKVAAASGNATVAGLLVRATHEDNNQCVIYLFGREITTASFAMYTSSLAVFVQALSLISFSSIADYGNYRKRLLVSFGFVGATTSMLFLIVVPQTYLLGSILVIIGVTCLGSSFVILNSFLPLLVWNHPLSRGNSSYSPPHSTSESLSREAIIEDPVESGRIPGTRRATPRSDPSELQISTRISSTGVGLGYVAAVFVQVLSILVLFIMSKQSTSSTLPLRLVLFMVGLWWFAFTLLSSMWLRNRPGPPLNTALSKSSQSRSCLAYIAFAWGSVWKTVKVAAQLRQVVIFLIAWFILSDAIATVSGTAILFARTELKMGTVAVALLSITATSSGIAGAFIWPIISRHYSWASNRTIIACIALMEIIPIYGLTGYIPFIQSWGVGGLQRSWEIYPLGVIHGFAMGGLSSYCRSFFGLLIPPGSEAAFYALYAITDKGSSAVGPTVVGMIVDATGTIRPAFFFLAVLTLLPLPLIWMVNVDQGQEDAARMAGLIKKTGDDDHGVELRGVAVVQEAEGLMRDHD